MPLSKKRAHKIKAIPESKIDYSDIPELGEEFWANAKLVRPKTKPKTKEVAYMHIDPEVVRWFRKEGRDYEARMNAVLRCYMESCKASRAK